MLQLKRPYKFLSPYWTSFFFSFDRQSLLDILCIESEESVGHHFLHCQLTLGFWHKLFSLAKMDWVQPKSICDMMNISFRGLGSFTIGRTFRQIVCITMLWIVWQEQNDRIFEKIWRVGEMSWDLLSLLFLVVDLLNYHLQRCSTQCYSTHFRDFPLNVIQLNWLSICNSKGVDNNERN